MRARNRWKNWSSNINYSVGRDSAVVGFSVISVIFSSLYSLSTDKSLNNPYLLAISFSASLGIGFGFYMLSAVHEHMNKIKRHIGKRRAQRKTHYIVDTNVFTFGILVFLFEILYFSLSGKAETEKTKLIYIFNALIVSIFNIIYMEFVENLMEWERKNL